MDRELLSWTDPNANILADLQTHMDTLRAREGHPGEVTVIVPRKLWMEWGKARIERWYLEHGFGKVIAEPAETHLAVVQPHRFGGGLNNVVPMNRAQRRRAARSR